MIAWEKMIRRVGRLILEGHHMIYHLIVGFFIGWVMARYSTDLNLSIALLISLPASWLPDLDHLLVLFCYGKDSAYGKAFHKVWSRGNALEVVKFCARNHKKNYGLYSHNLLVALATLFLGIVAIPSSPRLATFLLSVGGHLWFDVLDDLVILGRLNPNWFLKFSKK